MLRERMPANGSRLFQQICCLRNYLPQSCFLLLLHLVRGRQQTWRQAQRIFNTTDSLLALQLPSSSSPLSSLPHSMPILSLLLLPMALKRRQRMDIRSQRQRLLSSWPRLHWLTGVCMTLTHVQKRRGWREGRDRGLFAHAPCVSQHRFRFHLRDVSSPSTRGCISFWGGRRHHRRLCGFRTQPKYLDR